MKFIFLSVCLVFLAHSVSHGIEKADLLGEWETRIDEENEDGVLVRAREAVTFVNDGTYSVHSTYTSSLEGKPRLVTLIESKSGIWTLEDKVLKQKLTSTRIDFFSSTLAEMNRKSMDDALLTILEKPVESILVSQEENVLTFASSENGSKSSFKRRMNNELKQLSDDPTVESIKPDPSGKMIRFLSSEFLAFDGFLPATSLPTLNQRRGISGKLRPKRDVLDRLLCNYVSVMWVIMPEDKLPAETIITLIDKLKLTSQMTTFEKEILETERTTARKKYVDSINWKMESMNALAWALGANLMLDVNQEQMGTSRIQIIGQFLELVWLDKDVFLKGVSLKPLSEIIQMEDIFYCAHNAVRSARTGSEGVVPKDFHPIHKGGMIHEKRHVLTWLLSPSVKWADTDLST